MFDGAGNALPFPTGYAALTTPATANFAATIPADQTFTWDAYDGGDGVANGVLFGIFTMPNDQEIFDTIADPLTFTSYTPDADLAAGDYQVELSFLHQYPAPVRRAARCRTIASRAASVPQKRGPCFHLMGSKWVLT